MEITKNIRLLLLHNGSGRMEFRQFRQHHFRLFHVESFLVGHHLIATHAQILEAYSLVHMADEICVSENFPLKIGLAQ